MHSGRWRFLFPEGKGVGILGEDRLSAEGRVAGLLPHPGGIGLDFLDHLGDPLPASVIGELPPAVERRERDRLGFVRR
jgi:hypothetical protein